jgi:hypothetical protein
MRRLTSGGQGAAACTIVRVELQSYFARTSGGSASMRWNCVGTMWLVVTRYFSIRRRHSSGVHFSINTTGCPRCMDDDANTSTAV